MTEDYLGGSFMHTGRRQTQTVWWLALALLTLWAPSLSAEQQTGSLYGTVATTDDQALPGCDGDAERTGVDSSSDRDRNDPRRHTSYPSGSGVPDDLTGGDPSGRLTSPTYASCRDPARPDGTTRITGAGASCWRSRRTRHLAACTHTPHLRQPRLSSDDTRPSARSARPSSNAGE